MPVYRIHRMKDAPRQQFRLAPHISGPADIKTRDYEAAGEIEAENEYAAWALLRAKSLALSVGDLLESLDGQLKICKYVGFDEARWLILELPATPGATAAPASNPPVAGQPSQA